ncbi:MAG: hypothetical protein R6W06_02910 [Prochlorococcaceae cyanobacterium]
MIVLKQARMHAGHGHKHPRAGGQGSQSRMQPQHLRASGLAAAFWLISILSGGSMAAAEKVALRALATIHDFEHHHPAK